MQTLEGIRPEACRHNSDDDVNFALALTRLLQGGLQSGKKEAHLQKSVRNWRTDWTEPTMLVACTAERGIHHSTVCVAGSLHREA